MNLKVDMPPMTADEFRRHTEKMLWELDRRSAFDWRGHYGTALNHRSFGEPRPRHMPNLGPDTVEIFGQDAFTFDAIKRHQLGQRAVAKDGRAFRYCLAGASTLVSGNVLQASLPVANHLALTPSAAGIGAVQVVATLGATAAALNLYAEGWVQIDTTPGNGFMYGIHGHAAVLSSGVITANLWPDEPIQVALTTSSRVGFIANPYSGVLQCPTTNTAAVIGVALAPITNAMYGWIQTWGPAAVLINGTPAITAPVVNSATTAGAADKWTTAAADVAVTLVGNMLQVGVSAKNNAVMVKLAA